MHGKVWFLNFRCPCDRRYGWVAYFCSINKLKEHKKEGITLTLSVGDHPDFLVISVYFLSCNKRARPCTCLCNSNVKQSSARASWQFAPLAVKHPIIRRPYLKHLQVLHHFTNIPKLYTVIQSGSAKLGCIWRPLQWLVCCTFARELVHSQNVTRNRVMGATTGIAL